MECVLPSPYGMSISLLPDEPNPLRCQRTPVMHSLAALIQAIPSRVANPTVFLPFHRHAWLLQSTFFFLLSKQSRMHLPCPDCVGKSWGRRLAALTSWCPWACPAAGMQGVFCLARGFQVVQGSRFALKCDTKKKKGVKTFTIQVNSLKNAVCTVSLALSTLMQPGSWGYRLKNTDRRADHSLWLCCWGASLI